MWNKRIFHYDLNGNVDNIKYYDTIGGSFVITNETWYTYNGQGQNLQDSIVYYSTPAAIYKNEYSYVNGLLDTFKQFHLDAGSGWNFNQFINYDYDTAGNLIRYEYYSLFFPNPYTMQWRYDLTYDSNDFLISQILTQVTSTSTPPFITKDSFGYSGNNPLWIYSSSGQWNYTINNWQPILAYDYHLNNTGSWDNFVYQVWNGQNFYAVEKDTIIYNGDGLVEIQEGYPFDTATQTYAAAPYDRNRYYYESYDDGIIPTSINDIHANEKLTIYPNPVADVLYIQTPGNTYKGSEVKIYDITGRLCLSPAVKTDVIDVAAVPAGIYFLRAGAATVKFVKE